jgi:glycosyltransferase involved in cell wall biosynthesis
VNTYEHVAREAPRAGIELAFVTPAGFRTVPMPTYPEIPLSFATPGALRKRIEAAKPDYIHIATEGPIGLAARWACLQLGRRFTTSYHTRFPEYVSARFPVPVSFGYRFERWFHNRGAGVMAASKSLCDELGERGIQRVQLWSRGVDLGLFRPLETRVLDLPQPIFMYVGRVAVEKNLEAFLSLDLPGSKVVVGGGPLLETLKAQYPHAHFTGPKFGADLAAHYASADVFVFPSLTDTFGNVILEALACGTPAAAFPVTGPKDIITPDTGSLDADLRHAALSALAKSREACRAYAERFSWYACTRRFREIIELAHGKLPLLTP